MQQLITGLYEFSLPQIGTRVGMVIVLCVAVSLLCVAFICRR